MVRSSDASPLPTRRVRPGRAQESVWDYPRPPRLESTPRRIRVVDAVFLDKEQARPRPGGFSVGWVTSQVVGPFKGEPGSGGW
jgi:hypothetical protein